VKGTFAVYSVTKCGKRVSIGQGWQNLSIDSEITQNWRFLLWLSRSAIHDMQNKTIAV